MRLPMKSTLTRRLATGVGALILAFLLVACGGKTSTEQNNSSSTTNNSAAATSTANALTPTVIVVMKSYTGTGFTIKYPQNWKVASSANGVAFSDPSGTYNLSIGTTPNADGSVNAEKLVDGGITGAKANLKNVQTIALPATTNFAGQDWTQRAISGDNTYKGQTTAVQANILATNHPTHASNTKGYVIAYVALKEKFAQAKITYFMPMLQTFKFAA